MATTLVVNDIWQARYVCYTPDQVSVNTIHYLVDQVTGDSTTDELLAANLDTEAAPLFKAILSDDARYRGVSVQRIRPTPRTAAALAISNDGPGLVVGEILPAQVAGIASFRTAFAGRRFRGRIYLPFPSEASNELPGRPSDAYVTAADNLADNLVFGQTTGAGGNTASTQPVIYHRASQTATPMTSGASKKLWATQRRRGNFGRMNILPF